MEAIPLISRLAGISQSSKRVPMNKQKSGHNSTNIQANEIVVHQGIPYSEVKEIALDVFRANFYKLAGIARDTAKSRAEEITDIFLRKLQDENPGGFSKAQDPDFQYALFTMQREYARNGDKDLGELLVDLLVDRSKQEQRNILQIVLNESLNTAPKLTNDQLAALAIIFLLRYTINHSVGNHDLLGEYFDQYVLPFAKDLNTGNACYQHLEFTGCGSISVASKSLEDALVGNYQGLFSKGFDENNVLVSQLTVGLDRRYFIPCLNDKTRYQVKALNKEALEKLLNANPVSPGDKINIGALFDNVKMSANEVIDKCISLRPYMEKVFDVWTNSPMQNFNLTSVGIAIGHANIKRLTGEFANLAIWIN